jgi:phenylalanyl-tRNA synthetase alpha chain
MEIAKKIEEIQQEAALDLEAVKETRELEVLKIKYLGKKGSLHTLMPLLKTSRPEERPFLGKWINDLKEMLEGQFAATEQRLASAELAMRLQAGRLDVTLPGRRRYLGKRHLLLAFLDEAIEAAAGMGFTVQYGPDIDTDYYNFEALNFPKDHPARDMHDTFYITAHELLRTHTSNTQVRIMEGCRPPIRVIIPGKCFRKEDISARSHVLFHQIEGVYIDRNVTFADLLSTLEELFVQLLKRDIKMRLRPSYFPFVEPGVEVDINCIVCDGSGCSVCKHTGWLEVVGAGMIHPEVMKNGGIDPEEYTGFAWGFGIERLTMLKYGISDIRLFMEDRLAFLGQF